MKRIVLALNLFLISLGLFSQSLTIKKIGEWGNQGYSDVAINGNYAYCLNEDILDVINVSDPAQPFRAGGIIAADPLYKIVIHDGYAYILSFRGMSVFNISDPLHPALAAKIAMKDALGMEISGDHAFVATMNQGIKIIDIQDPLHPQLINTYAYAGVCSSLRVSGTTMYVAEYISESDSKLKIVDIADPLNPALLGTFNTTSSINALEIGSSHAFLGGWLTITIVDVSNPQAPAQVAVYNDQGHPYRLRLRNDYLYVGASGDGSFAYGGIRILDVSVPANPQLIGDYSFPADIPSIILHGDLLFFPARNDYYDQDFGLQIVNISNPAFITPTGSFNTSGQPSALEVKGGYGYLCDVSFGFGIRVLNVTDPLAINQVGLGNPPEFGSRITISGNYAYCGDSVGGGNHALGVFDLTTPTAPNRVGSCAAADSFFKPFLSGNYLFVPESSAGLQIFNVSNPASPYSVTVYDTPGYAYGVFVSGNYAYVADLGSGLTILNVSDPANPAFVSGMTSLSGALDVVVSGTIAYVSTTNGLYVVNVADPAAPAEIGSFLTSSRLDRFILSGNFLYAVQRNDGLLVLDVSDPAHPVQAGFYRYWYAISDFFKSGERVYLVDNEHHKVVIVQAHGQYLHLTSPNGAKPEPEPEPAERWQVGDSHDIIWTGTGNMGNVKLEYSIDEGFIWHTIAASTEDDGAYSWTVPDAISDVCLVRVSDPDGVASDASDAVFSIANDPRLWLTSPIGGESWMISSIHDITWTSGGPVGNITIDYTIDSGANWIPIASGTANDGAYAWTVPDTPSNTCYMRLRGEGGFPEAQNEAFSIVAYVGETVSEPTALSGPATVAVTMSYAYETGGSASSWSDPVQYFFDWGDTTNSGWLAVGTTAAAHSWATAGTYSVRSMSRCATHTAVVSPWSTTAITVTANEGPTWVGISRFDACAEESRPTVEWHTASELGAVGFNLWRQDRETKQYDLVNQSLLPALTNSPQGGIYRFSDPGAFPGEPVVYRLEEIDAQGRTISYGPFTVTFGGAAQQEPYDPGARMGKEEPSGIDGYQRFEREQSLFEQERLQARRQEQQRGVLMAAVSKERARITVKGRGLFYVTATQIARALGLAPATVAQLITVQNLNLTYMGKSIAWLADRNGAGLFFYNEGIKTVYSERNVYFLERGRGLAMETFNDGGGSPTGADRSFSDTLHFEGNRYSLLLSSMDPAGDLWFWDYIVAGGEAKSFAVQVPGVAAVGQATLRVALQGATELAAGDDHHVVISLNGSRIGESTWDGTAAHAFEVSFAPSLLREGANTISVSGALDMGAASSVFYVESFDLSYQRYYKAVGNNLICRGDNNPVITVSGMTELQTVVLDVSNPARPKYLKGAAPDVSGRITFVPRAAANTYLVSGLNAALRPLAVNGDRPAQLKGGSHSAEYIVIAPEEFKETAQQLASYRQGKGLKSLVVTLEDIYEAYNFGMPSPLAIRAFLAEAYRKGSGKKVKYAVLAGKGTYDYNDFQGQGDNLVPVILGQTPNGLCAADKMFGDVSGKDGLPEIAIGRLPAVTNAELGAMIDKIKAYEESQGAWTGKALFIADDTDNGGDFAQGCNELAALAFGLTAEKFYLNGAVAETRVKINAAWNAGAALVTYCGHGALNQLAKENLFDISGAAALLNGNQLPLAAMFTCTVGRFEIPGFTTLGETLLLNNHGGAVAGLFPSGAAMHDDSLRLGEEFFKAMLRSGGTASGTALVSAMKSYLQQGGVAYLLNMYNWLGDPALKVK